MAEHHKSTPQPARDAAERRDIARKIVRLALAAIERGEKREIAEWVRDVHPSDMEDVGRRVTRLFDAGVACIRHGIAIKRENRRVRQRIRICSLTDELATLLGYTEAADERLGIEPAHRAEVARFREALNRFRGGGDVVAPILIEDDVIPDETALLRTVDDGHSEEDVAVASGWSPARIRKLRFDATSRACECGAPAFGIANGKARRKGARWVCEACYAASLKCEQCGRLQAGANGWGDETVHRFTTTTGRIICPGCYMREVMDCTE